MRAVPTQSLVLVLVLALLGLSACAAPVAPDYGRQLPPGSPALLPLAPGEAPPDIADQWDQRTRIQPALEQSLEWMRKPSARRHFPIEGVSYERALESLERFAEILATSGGAEDFAATVADEFDVYRAAGWDGRGGGVLFTGYCTPVLDGSRERTDEYLYPLYALPPDLAKGEDGEILGQRTAAGGLRPYPTRAAIEAHGLLAGQGLELVWMRDPMDAYIAHVNGSAVIRLTDGSELRLGYAGKNGREYRSLRAELVKRGAIDPVTGGLADIREWSRRTPPEEVLSLLQHNESYVFFTPIQGTPRGSLNVPVTPERTLATDKALFPRGGIVFVDTRLPRSERVREVPFRQFLFDQDTGGAIRTAGRADIYIGVGERAERTAGRTASQGQMYYYFLKRRPRGA